MHPPGAARIARCYQQGQRAGNVSVSLVCPSCPVLKNGPELNHGRAVSLKGPGRPTLEKGRTEPPADCGSVLSSGRPAVTAGDARLSSQEPRDARRAVYPPRRGPEPARGSPMPPSGGDAHHGRDLCAATRPASRGPMGPRGPPSERHTAWLEKRRRAETVPAEHGPHGPRGPVCPESHVRPTRCRALRVHFDRVDALACLGGG